MSVTLSNPLSREEILTIWADAAEKFLSTRKASIFKFAKITSWASKHMYGGPVPNWPKREESLARTAARLGYIKGHAKGEDPVSQYVRGDQSFRNIVSSYAAFLFEDCKTLCEHHDLVARSDNKKLFVQQLHARF